MSGEATRSEVRVTTLALLARRAAGATLCPSEVARAMAAAGGGGEWRGRMPDVHAEIARMVAEGLVQLSWRGASRQAREGPYRIGLPGGSIDPPVPRTP